MVGLAYQKLFISCGTILQRRGEPLCSPSSNVAEGTAFRIEFKLANRIAAMPHPVNFTLSSSDSRFHVSFFIHLGNII